MSISGADTWGGVRQAFADQFEQDGTAFIYRKSQKGEAIRVSAEERSRFIDDFNRSLSTAKWIIYIGTIVVLCGVGAFSLMRGSDFLEPGVFVGLAVAMVPYLLYYRRAWSAPAHDLTGRTPIAGERSSDDAQRLKFQRISYSQLGIAALTGLGLPLFIGAKEDVLSGWHRLWLVCGAALVLLAAVQAFRKWRLEGALTNPSGIRWQSSSITPVSTSAPVSRRLQFWRYLPIAIILVGLASIAYLPAAKRLAQTTEFWPIILFAFGCWALFTVVRGLQNGRVEPMARGFYSTYERHSEPKRYWVSMAWNGILGSFCVSMPLLTYTQGFSDDYQTRCDNAEAKYSPQEALAACDSLIEKRRSENGPLLAAAFWGRGNARDAGHDFPGAIADYSQALRITPNSRPLLENRAGAFAEEGAAQQSIEDYDRVIELNPHDSDGYDDRAYAYEQLLHDRIHAIRDYSAAIAIKPNDAIALFRRGMCYGRNGDYQDAVADLSAVIRLRPNDAVAYYFRSFGYRDLGDADRAASDLATAERLNPKLVAQVRRNPSAA